MYMMLLRLTWFYFGRMLADKLAHFLEDRREHRLKALQKISQAMNLMENPECPPCPPCPPCPAPELAEMDIQPVPISTGNKIWFGLSGVLLGSAFVLMGYLFTRDNRA